MNRRQGDKLHAAAAEECVGTNEQGIGASDKTKLDWVIADSEDRLRARLQARAGEDRLEAPRAPVSVGPVEDLAQDQEPGGARRDAV
jgi:hypothetical protein